MISWFNSCVIYLGIIVLSREVSADSASLQNYTIHHTRVSFEQALETCSPGVLTTIATEQEVTNILGLISSSIKSALPDNEFTFWVGLRKSKNKCVVPQLPLRGFKWTADGSEESEVSRWVKEPQDSCTSVRCAVLQGEYDGSAVTRWGLNPVTCKNTHQFICKLRDEQPGQTSERRKTTTDPITLQPTPAAPESPEPTTAEPALPTQGPEPENDMTFKTEPELQGPEPGSGSGLVPGSDSCQHPFIPGARSLTLDDKNKSRIRLECWSTVQLELRCWGRPATWYLLDDSPVNFTTICQPCSDGFQKNASGHCTDIDECNRGVPCRHTCLNTEGSYRCVCSDENGQHHDEGSSECTVKIDDRNSLSGILIPVLVAVVALVVLVGVVAVVVKCCLMRRSKKRAKKSDKNKDSAPI